MAAGRGGPSLQISTARRHGLHRKVGPQHCHNSNVSRRQILYMQLLRRKDSTDHCPGDRSRRSSNELGPVEAESQGACSQQPAYHAG